MHCLEPHPVTAPVVPQMFAQRLARHSLAQITRALNDAGTPCPSAADPGRNPHRSGQAWTLTAVPAILANPRYTGRQGWNRHRTDHDLIDPGNTTLGHRQVQRWNLPAGWVIPSPGPSRAGQRGRIHRRPGDQRAMRPSRPGHAPVHAGRPDPLRNLRTAARIHLVQRSARLPVPPRLHQRRPPGPGRAKTRTSARTRSLLTWPPSPSCSLTAITPMITSQTTLAGSPARHMRSS